MRTFPMTRIGPGTRLEAALANLEARAIVQAAMPGVVNSPLILQLGKAPLSEIVERVRDLSGNEEAAARFWAALGQIDESTTVRRHELFRSPNPRLDPPTVETASSAATWTETVQLHGYFELTLTDVARDNPFLDVDLDVDFTGPAGQTRAGGFYDGDGIWRVRLYASRAGDWTFRTRSNARGMNGVSGAFTVTTAQAGPGVVRVADTFHFRHDNGDRHLPLGTTAYAWHHQPTEREELTLATLETSPFTKVRMSVFPKAYLYNSDEPERLPFEPTVDGGFDPTRFDIDFFQHLDRRVQELAARGIEADIVLYHAYDRWGFSDLDPVADDRYVRYVVRRLGAFANVWWSMANEYDLVRSKTEADWERLAGIVTAEDPSGHLLSIHNGFDFYDYTKAWVTHCSVQRIDLYRTAENTDLWRERWNKPIVIDECGYEGDIEQGWGNLTPEEFVRRAWEGAVRGGYVNHGETYRDPNEVLWWSKGGVLRGRSPQRIAFLRGVIEASPAGVLDPLPGDWDVPWGGVADRYIVVYLGAGQSALRSVQLPEGEWRGEILDTWEMTVLPIGDALSGLTTIELPSKPYLALRFCRD